jgi:hypothetical protein
MQGREIVQADNHIKEVIENERRQRKLAHKQIVTEVNSQLIKHKHGALNVSNRSKPQEVSMRLPMQQAIPLNNSLEKDVSDKNEKIALINK